MGQEGSAEEGHRCHPAVKPMLVLVSGALGHILGRGVWKRSTLGLGVSGERAEPQVSGPLPSCQALGMLLAEAEGWGREEGDQLLREEGRFPSPYGEEVSKL